MGVLTERFPRHNSKPISAMMTTAPHNAKICATRSIGMMLSRRLISLSVPSNCRVGSSPVFSADEVGFGVDFREPAPVLLFFELPDALFEPSDLTAAVLPVIVTLPEVQAPIGMYAA